MSGGPVSFGSYNFPSTINEWRSNFGDGVTNTVRLPGMTGGWNEYGCEALPGAIGQVTIGFTLLSATRAAMDDLRDAVMALRGVGQQALVYQPTDPADGTRFCWAHVNNISMSQRKDLHTDLWQDVKIIFHVPYPAWLGGNYGGLKYGASAGKYGAGKKYGHGALSQACSGTSTSFTVTNNGNAISVAKMTLSPQSAPATAQNPIIQRIKNGAVVDEVRWIGTLIYGQQLEVDGPKQRIAVSGTDAFADAEYQHPDLLRLEPGANSLKVIMTNSGDAATAFLYFYDVYL